MTSAVTSSAGAAAVLGGQGIVPPPSSAPAGAKTAMFLPLVLIEKCLGGRVTVGLFNGQEIAGVLRFADPEGKFNVVLEDAEVRDVAVRSVSTAGASEAAGSRGGNEEIVVSAVRGAQHVLINGRDVAFISPVASKT